MKKYEEYMQKAHGVLILERENEIITEIRATRAYLKDKIDVFEERMDNKLEVVDARLEKIEQSIGNVEALLKELLSRP